MKRITSRRNPIVMHLKKLGTSRDYRRESGEFLCDGKKLFNEAEKSGIEMVCIVTKEELSISAGEGVQVFQAPGELIDSISPLKNAQDIIFSCKIPKREIKKEQKGVRILLDGVQDPGNLGTIIRTADAFGISQVLLIGGCADLYNPKTLRAAMGGVFRQEVMEISYEELRSLVKGGQRLIGASLSGRSLEISQASVGDSIIALGSEGKGLSKEVLMLCSELIKIPIREECESLNAAAAAAIIMWEARVENTR